MDTTLFMVCFTFFGRIFEFGCGIALALYIGRSGAFFPRAPVGHSFVTWFALGLCGLIIWGIARQHSDPYVLAQLHLDSSPYGIHFPAGILLNNAMLPIAVAFLYYGLIVEKTWIAALLGSRIFVLPGRSSYAFYLIHMGVLAKMDPDRVTANGWQMLPVLLAISIAIYKGFEEPLNRMLRGNVRIS